MRCKVAKRRMNESIDGLDRELLEHILECPSCARAAEAAGILRKVFQAARENETQLSTPLEIIRTRIESKAQESKRKVAIMARIKRQFRARPGLVTGFGLGLIAFLFVTLVPFSYTRTVGYNLTCPKSDAQYEISTEKYEDALELLGITDVSVRSAGEYYEVGNLASRRAARQAALTYAALTDSEDKSEITEVKRKVAGSLYAQAKENYRLALKNKNRHQISITTEGMTDEEIKEAILKKLAENGWTDAQVRVSTEPDGNRRISVQMSTPDSSHQEMFELETSGTAEDIYMDFGTAGDKLDIDTEGKSDEEIRQEIIEKLKDQSIIDPEVEVITTPDGQKEIKINIRKEEESK